MKPRFHKLHPSSVVLLQPGQDKAELITLAGSGEFYWKAGPGEYTLVSFQYFGGGGRNNIHIGAKFIVPDAPARSVGRNNQRALRRMFGKGIAVAMLGGLRNKMYF